MIAASSLTRPLLGALLIIASAAALAWLAPAYLGPDMAHRLLGALFGAVVVVYANDIPKVIGVCSGAGRSRARSQAARRFAGWAMVLGGVAYMLAWLLAPIDMARPLAAGVLASALLAALIRCLKKEAP